MNNVERFGQEGHNEISPIAAMALENDIKELGLRDGVMWAFQDQERAFEDLTNATLDPHLHKLLRDITNIVSNHPSWDIFSIPDIGQPLGYQDRSLTTPQALERILETFKKRESIEQQLLEKYGTTQFRINIGNMAPLEFNLSDDIRWGAARFELWDAADYKGKDDKEDTRIYLGFVDVDIEEKELQLSVMQDQSGVIDNRSTEENEKEKRNLKKVAETRKKKIRKVMQEGRQKPVDPYEEETAGVEELMSFLAADILARINLLNPDDATLLIPSPDVQLWSETGRDEAIFWTLGRAFLQQPEEVQIQFRRLFANDYLFNISKKRPYELGHLLYLDKNLQRNRNRTIITQSKEEEFVTTTAYMAEEYLARLFISALPEKFRPTAEESTPSKLQFGKGFALIQSLSSKTNWYLKTFHAYRTAFSDLPSQHTALGRQISIEEIGKLPFSQKIQIETQN